MIKAEGVVEERTADQVAPHKHPLVAETRFGRERVGGTQVSGRGLVCRTAHPRSLAMSPCRFPNAILCPPVPNSRIIFVIFI